MRPLLDALRFLTRLPLGAAPPPGERRLAAAAAWFPAAGAVVGAASAGAYALAHALWGPLPAAVLATLAAVAVTGGLHLDGLADTADGLGCAGGPAQRLAAMRDPRAGSMGVIAVALDLFLRVSLLSTLAPREAALAALAAPVVGRWAMVAAMPLHPYARPEGGLGRPFAAHVGRRLALAAGALAALLVGAASLASAHPARALPALLAALLLGTAAPLLAARAAAGRLGGLTGDVYGALNETGEITCLAVLAALLPGGL